MLITTIESIPGKSSYRVLGLASGSTVRSKHLGKDIVSGLKSIVGGELRGYTEMMVEARNQAMQRMIEEAVAMGANAVIGVRFSSSMIMASASEILCYGTAVVI